MVYGWVSFLVYYAVSPSPPLSLSLFCWLAWLRSHLIYTFVLIDSFTCPLHLISRWYLLSFNFCFLTTYVRMPICLSKTKLEPFSGEPLHCCFFSISPDAIWHLCQKIKLYTFEVFGGTRFQHCWLLTLKSFEHRTEGSIILNWLIFFSLKLQANDQSNCHEERPDFRHQQQSTGIIQTKKRANKSVNWNVCVC